MRKVIGLFGPPFPCRLVPDRQGRRPRSSRQERVALEVEELRFRKAGTEVIHSFFLLSKPINSKGRQRSAGGRYWRRYRSFANPKTKESAVLPFAVAVCLETVQAASIFICAMVSRPANSALVFRESIAVAPHGSVQPVHLAKLWNVRRKYRKRPTRRLSAAEKLLLLCLLLHTQKLCRSHLSKTSLRLLRIMSQGVV